MRFLFEKDKELNKLIDKFTPPRTEEEQLRKLQNNINQLKKDLAHLELNLFSLKLILGKKEEKENAFS